MSLPMARARRKNVPSTQRSPNSRTRSHSATESREAERGDVAGRLELRDLPVVLHQAHLRGDPREVGVAALVGRRRARRRRRRRRGGPGSCRRATGRPRAGRCGAPRAPGSRRSPSATGGGRPTARRTAGHGRTRRWSARSAGGRRGRSRRPRRPAPRRWSGCRRSRCARCRGGSGSRCRRTAPCSPPAGSTSRSPGKASASFWRRACGVRRDRVRRQVELAVAPALAHEGGVRRGHGRIVRLGVELGLAGLVGGRVGGLFAHARSLRPRRPRTRRGKTALR